MILLKTSCNKKDTNNMYYDYEWCCERDLVVERVFSPKSIRMSKVSHSNWMLEKPTEANLHDQTIIFPSRHHFFSKTLRYTVRSAKKQQTQATCPPPYQAEADWFSSSPPTRAPPFGESLRTVGVGSRVGHAKQSRPWKDSRWNVGKHPRVVFLVCLQRCSSRLQQDFAIPIWVLSTS